MIIHEVDLVECSCCNRLRVANDITLCPNCGNAVCSNCLDKCDYCGKEGCLDCLSLCDGNCSNCLANIGLAKRGDYWDMRNTTF